MEHFSTEQFTNRDQPVRASRAVLATAVAVILVGLLTGCGGSNSASTPSSAPASNPGSVPSPDTTPPSTPIGLSATPASPSQINLSWGASTDNVGVTGYKIFRNGTLVGSTTNTSYASTGLTPATTYSHTVQAYDTAGNHSAISTAANTTTSSAQANVYYGNPTNYLALLRSLVAGDTLILEPGNYDDPSDGPGLPIFNMNGTATQPITIMGQEGQPRPVLLGRSTHNTVRFSDASYVVIKHIEIDGRDLGGDGVNAQGNAHHITLGDLVIRGVGQNQQVVGISSNGGTTWDWVIRRCQIIGAGTGMYLGNPNGGNPFVAGVIEHNIIRDTIGYNIQIKHQITRPTIAGLPTGKNSTIIRHNVFSKSANSSSGADARPNVLMGHFPLSGAGADDVYEIYSNFFYQNPTEALFQGEGNIAFHHNLLVNDSGSAVVIQPHNDVPKMIRVFNNTVITAGTGIRVSGGSTAYTQKIVGNAVFAATPISAADQTSNITDTHPNARNYLNNPSGTLGQLDLFPKTGMLSGAAIDSSSFNTFLDWDRDFNSNAQGNLFRGAYSGEGTNPGWIPRLEIKP
jgi:hypothetical protein